MINYLLTGATTDVVTTITEQITPDKLTASDYFTTPAFYLSLLCIAVFIVLWIFITKGKKKVLENTKQKYPNDPQRLALINVVSIVVRAILIVAALTLFLHFNGIEINALMVVVLLLIGVVALAGQDAMKDCIAGLLIFINQYFKIGDVIKYDSAEGEVIKMTIFSTRIKDLKSEDIITISNRKITEARVMSHYTGIPIGLPYDLPAATAHEVLKKACEEIKKIEGIEDCIYKGTNDFDNSAIVYLIGIYSKPDKKYVMRRAALMKIQDCLAEANIPIPFQQIDVHISNK